MLSLNKNNAQSKKGNLIRAGLEISLFLGTGLVGYNYWQERMQDDWEFEYKTVDDFMERLITTDQVKFDDNDIIFNWGHVYAGAFYYQVGRVNGFNNYESMVLSVVGSSVWEYFIEFREAISINDQIMTGFGGAILGETFHQVANLLKRRSKTLLSQILASYYQPIDLADTLLDKSGIFKMDIKHQPMVFIKNDIENFEIFSGLKTAKRDNKDLVTLIQLGLQAELVNLPVKSEGESSRPMAKTAAVELIQEFGLRYNGLRDYYSYTKVVPSAYFVKNISEDKSGYSLFVGPAAGTEYNSRGFAHEQDFYAMVNLLGATIDFSLYNKGKSLRMLFDAYGDFAFVRPYATTQYYEAGNNYVGAKTVLRKKNYYYAIGTSLRSRIELRPTNKLELGLMGAYHNFNSFDEGEKDRHADQVGRSLELKDRIASVKTWISYKLKYRWKVSGAIEHSFRSGNVDEIESTETKSFYVSDRETTFQLNLNYDIL